MVTIGMNYYVLPGKEQIFEDACAKVVKAMEDDTGHESSQIYKELGCEKPAYLIVSRWQSEDAFKEFVASDAFKKVTSWGAENILSGRPQHTTYRDG